jgi:CheY-like chemotaxis protein
MPPKILLVDDVKMFLELQKDFLRLSTVHVLTATNGADALLIAQQARPDLIFTDLYMPVMNGADCCAALKADPELRQIPVVMITAEGKETDKQLCRDAGCDDFLTKPLDRKIYLGMAHRYVPNINRRDKRVACRAKAKFRIYGINSSGYITDIGNNGIYMETDVQVEQGTLLEMVFALPDKEETIIQARGKVAWTNATATKLKATLPAGFGVEFVAINEDSRVAVARYVQKKSLREHHSSLFDLHDYP